MPGILDRVFSLVSGTTITNEVLESFDEQVKDVNEAANLITQTLASYGARKLRIQRRPEFSADQVTRADAQAAIVRFGMDWQAFLREHGERGVYRRHDVLDALGADYTEIGGFLHYLINLEDERVPVTELPLDRTLAVSWLDFKTVSDTMAVQNLSGTRAGAMLSMAEWPSRTPSRMLDEFLRQPVEYIITQSFFFTDRISAEHDMRQERRRIAVNDHEGVAQEDKDEITQGLQDLSRGRSVNGLHHLSMLVHVPATTTSSTLSPTKRKRLRTSMPRSDC